MADSMMVVAFGAAYVLSGLLLLGISLGSFGSKLTMEPERVRSQRQ